MKALLIKDKQNLFEVFSLTELKSCEIDLLVVKSIDEQRPDFDVATIETDVISHLTNEFEKAYLYYSMGRMGLLIQEFGTKYLIEKIENHIKNLQSN